SKTDCGPEYSLPQSNLPRQFLNMRSFYCCFCHDNLLLKLVDCDKLRCGYFFPSPLTVIRVYVTQKPALYYTGTHPMSKDPRLFDIIVLAGMVVNIILAVFLLIYYFDLL